eukprot:TRINITY_DN5124_c0_g1_i1.p1 TRINITY_DN5124_c0_g1~~TRINITY_DN5124_c0_g1_i1.p1  ORF type:complete len:383 (+),score=55.69 TRINITY_DN5124_c0_g1_i1:105-1253(+)
MTVIRPTAPSTSDPDSGEGQGGSQSQLSEPVVPPTPTISAPAVTTTEWYQNDAAQYPEEEMLSLEDFALVDAVSRATSPALPPPVNGTINDDTASLPPSMVDEADGTKENMTTTTVPALIAPSNSAASSSTATAPTTPSTCRRRHSTGTRACGHPTVTAKRARGRPTVTAMRACDHPTQHVRARQSQRKVVALVTVMTVVLLVAGLTVTVRQVLEMKTQLRQLEQTVATARVSREGTGEVVRALQRKLQDMAVVDTDVVNQLTEMKNDMQFLIEQEVVMEEMAEDQEERFQQLQERLDELRTSLEQDQDETVEWQSNVINYLQVLEDEHVDAKHASDPNSRSRVDRSPRSLHLWLANGGERKMREKVERRRKVGRQNQRQGA